ncbi:hypothetical protein Zm00014a_004623 [Zea mays]|uniref:Uncharacterized protein n=1 Tax=Zea mays TaxID=4577 RepID=A0A3L6G3R0_MAIZE|nr:hypothetical protein Zm00014a_004623 [Zea mays]
MSTMKFCREWRSLTITVSIGTRCTTLLGSEPRSCRM